MMSNSYFLNHSDKPKSEIVENKGELKPISLNHICKGKKLTIKYTEKNFSIFHLKM